MISSMIDPVRHTMPVRVQLPNPEGLLKPNIYAQMRFSVKPPEGAMEITGDRFGFGRIAPIRVRRESKGKFARREVVAGPAHEGKVSVLRASKGRDRGSKGALLLDNQIALHALTFPHVRPPGRLRSSQSPFRIHPRRGDRSLWVLRLFQFDGGGVSDPTDTQVQVITSFEGQPTEEVERRISIPIERALNGSPGLFRLRSISLFGFRSSPSLSRTGSIRMRARQQVVERLSTATLSAKARTPSLARWPPPSARSIGTRWRERAPIRWRCERCRIGPCSRGSGKCPASPMSFVRRACARNPCRARPNQDGGARRRAFRRFHRAQQGERQRDRRLCRTRLRRCSLSAASVSFKDMADIESVRVAYHGGVPVLVRDVASVREGYAPRQGVVTRDQNEDAVEGIVLMRRGENPSVVLDALREKIADLNDRILPKGVRVVAFYDRTELVKTTLKTVFKNLAEGAALVTLVLFAFMLSVRASLIVAAVIPLSLGASFIYLYVRGMSANLLSMGAVDFGIIVDGAVILVEHLFHRFRFRTGLPRMATTRTCPQRRPFWVASPRPASEVSRPTLFSLLIIIAAYLPIFSLQRVEGRIFSPLANTVVSALVGALLVSFTLVPVLCFYALRRPKAQKESPILVWAQRALTPAPRLCDEEHAPRLGPGDGSASFGRHALAAHRLGVLAGAERRLAVCHRHPSRQHLAHRRAKAHS